MNFMEIIFCCFIFCFSIQLFYLIYFHGSLLFYKPKHSVFSKDKVTVIVAAHNEEANVEQCVRSILNQDYECFDLIVVNDRSHDKTLEILNSIVDFRLNVITVSETPMGWDSKKWALETAISNAQNQWLLFTDADCVPCSNQWISLMLEARQGRKIVLGVSQYQKKKGFLNLFIQYETFTTAINYLGFTNKKLTYMGVGRNFLYHKSLYIEANKFDKIQSFTGGDDDLLVQKFCLDHDVNFSLSYPSQTLSVPKKSFTSYYHQKKRHLSIGKYYQKKYRILLGLQSFTLFWYLVLGVCLVLSKEYFIIALLLISLRSILQFIIFKDCERKISGQFESVFLPLFEVIGIGYLSVVGLIGIISNKARWE